MEVCKRVPPKKTRQGKEGLSRKRKPRGMASHCDIRCTPTARSSGHGRRTRRRAPRTTACWPRRRETPRERQASSDGPDPLSSCAPSLRRRIASSFHLSSSHEETSRNGYSNRRACNPDLLNRTPHRRHRLRRGHIALEMSLKHPEAVLSLTLVSAGSGQTNEGVQHTSAFTISLYLRRLWKTLRILSSNSRKRASRAAIGREVPKMGQRAAAPSSAQENSWRWRYRE